MKKIYIRKKKNKALLCTVYTYHTYDVKLGWTLYNPHPEDTRTENGIDVRPFWIEIHFETNIYVMYFLRRLQRSILYIYKQQEERSQG